MAECDGGRDADCDGDGTLVAGTAEENVVDPVDPVDVYDKNVFNPKFFAKAFTAAVKNLKNFASISRKNNMEFYCGTVVVEVQHNGKSVFPLTEYFMKWYEDLFLKELKPKVLNEIALANMRAKGIEIEQEPPLTDILLIFISASHTQVVGAVSFNPTSSIPDFSKFVSDALGKKFSGNMTVNIVENIAYFTRDAEYPVKEKDDVLQNFFDTLKEYKLYDPTDDDDEVIENMLDCYTE